jgi:hypothetical protein
MITQVGKHRLEHIRIERCGGVVVEIDRIHGDRLAAARSGERQPKRRSRLEAYASSDCASQGEAPIAIGVRNHFDIPTNE